MDREEFPIFASSGETLPPPRYAPDLVGLGLKSDTGLLVLGEEVSFLWGEEENIIACDPDYLLVRDLSGDIWNPCDLHVLPALRNQVGLGKALSDTEELAQKYYGKGARLQEVDLARPSGPWQHRGRIDTIWYKRRGRYQGRYTHRFAFPIALQAQGHRAYRLRLPEGCVANDRGIVWP